MLTGVESYNTPDFTVESGGFQKVKPEGYDTLTQGQYIMQYEHHEVHAGRHFYHGGFEAKDLNEVIDFWFHTENGSRQTHLDFAVEGTDKTTMYVWEGAAYDADSAGTAIVPLNSNRNSSYTSVNCILKDAVLTTTGSLILSQSVGATKQTEFITRDNEIVLKENTEYLFRFISGANGNIINYKADWYEHIPKN